MIEALKKALEGVEHGLDLDSLHIMPKDDFTSLTEGHKAALEDTKVKSNKIGQEILLKTLKNDLGLDFENRKDPEAFKKALEAKFTKADGTPNADIKDLQSKFDKALEEKESEILGIKNTYKKESDNKTIRESLRSEFSQFEGKTNYKTDDLVTIALSKNEFSVVDGKVFKSKDGEVVQDDMYKTTDSNKFANTMMLEDGYIKKADGGRVIGDETKGGKYTMEQYMAAAESNSENVNSQEFAQKLDSDVKSGKVEL